MNKNLSKLNAIIIDDEKEARETLKFILKNLDYSVNLIGEAETPQEAVKLINRLKPDIIFLDIELNNGTGFDVLKNFPEPDFKIIFVTGFNEFAIKAFRCSAIDYILKPVDPDILEEAIGKVFTSFNKNNFGRQVTTLLNNVSKQEKSIVLNTNDAIYVIDVQDIIRCQSDVNYTNFFLKNKQKIVVSRPLKEFEEILEDQKFFRIHQSHLINIKYLEKYDKHSQVVILSDGTKLPVSHRRKDKFINFILNHK